MSQYPLATVGALIVSPQDRLLFIRTHKWRNYWGVPGGKIDYGESIKQALIREFKEETNLTIHDIHWGPVQESILSPEFHKPAHFILLNFIARSTTETVTLNNEAQHYRWLHNHDATTLNLNTPTRHLLEFYQTHGFSTPVVT